MNLREKVNPWQIKALPNTGQGFYGIAVTKRSN